MASNDDYQAIRSNLYTFGEVIKEMKARDMNVTPTTTAPLQWVDVRTGKQVTIGYNR